jgi:oligopeptide transport system ATP-binding protein
VSASPAPDPLDRDAKRRIVLRGDPPSPITPPSGCAFHPRCPLAQPVCTVRKPPLRADADGHAVACHRTAEDRRLRGVDLLDLLRGGPTVNLLTPEGTPT